MGNRRRNNAKKPKKTNKFSKDNRTATSLSEITEVEVDEKKVTKESHRSTDEIQAQEGIISNMTKLTDDKETRQDNFINEKIFEEIEESVTICKRLQDKYFKIGDGKTYSTEHQDSTISILERYKGLDKLLRNSHRMFFANTKTPIRLSSEHIERLFNIFYISNEMSKPDEKGKSSLVLRALKEVRNASDAQRATTLRKAEDGANKITADLRNTDGDRAVDVIQKPTRLPQTFSIKDKVKKEDKGSTSHIQEKEESSDDSEFDAETLMKILNRTDERKGKTKAGSEMKHENEMANFSTNRNKRNEISKQDIIDAEEIESSKADKRNDIIVELKKVEDYEKGNKECDSSRDYIEVSAQFPLNTTEDKNEGKKGKECIDRSNEDMQDCHLNKGMLKTKQEVEDSLRKNNKDKTLSLEKTKVLPAGGLNTEFDKPKEKVIEMEKSCDLHFYLDTAGNKKIASSDKNFPNHVESKDRYNFKYENIQVSFTGNHIFVSTEDSEFDIFIRKSDRVNLASEATQTDTLP